MLLKLLMRIGGVFAVFFLPFLVGTRAFGYAEMVRHGYVNCTACHISPSGGGVLTDYGRALSKEILSTTSLNEEERLAYFFKTPKWLQLGGDFRAISIEQHTGTSLTELYIPMQRDIEAAVTIKKSFV